MDNSETQIYYKAKILKIFIVANEANNVAKSM